MSLYPIDPGPLPPSVREMEQAILDFAAEWQGADEAQASPADLALLGIAERVRRATSKHIQVQEGLAPAPAERETA